MKESVVERALVTRIKKIGGEIRKVTWPGRRGAPDRVAMFPKGLLVWIETKAPSGTLADHQKREHARLRKMGQQVDVIWNLDEINKSFPL